MQPHAHRGRSALVAGALAALSLAPALSLGGCRAADARMARAHMESGMHARDAGAATEGATPVAAVVPDGPPIARSGASDDCGAEALAAALANAGVRRDVADVRAAIFERGREGAPTSALVRYARDQRVFALARERWMLDDLKAWVRAGVAPIVLLSAPPPYEKRFHYVLLKGYDDARRVVLLEDGDDREFALTYERFFPRWCDGRGFALAVCDPAITLPEDGARLTAHEFGALGWLAEEEGELEAARRHYLAALVRDPAHAAAARNLANVERALDERDEDAREAAPVRAGFRP